MDIVYTYVASIDKKWQKKYEEHKGHSLSSEGYNPRYNYCGEIIASLLFLNKNVENIRKIFLVSDTHRLDKSFLPKKIRDKIRYVDHKDIIPHKYLPTFNSNVIETFLWKIKHLSSYFIYLNDDVFINKPVDLKKLRGKIYCSRYNIKYKLDGKHNWKYSLINANILFKKYYPHNTFYINTKHTPYVANRDICRFVFNKMEKELDKTLKYKFRKKYINGTIRFLSIVGSVSILKGKQRIIPFHSSIAIQKINKNILNYNKYYYINLNALKESEIDIFIDLLKKCKINLKILPHKINSILYIK